MHLTEHQAKVAIAVHDKPGTVRQISDRSGVNMASTQKNLKRLIIEGQVERVHTWPLTYRWTGDTAFVVKAAGVLSKISR